MPNSNRMERIENVARRHVKAGAFAGIEWKIMHKGNIFAQGRHGTLPEHPIYRIYSMTKPVISAVAMMLVEQGKLRLTDPLAAHLPGFASMQVRDADGSLTVAAPITIEHLLTHRAGLSYGFVPDCPIGALYRQHKLADAKPSLADFVDTLAGLPLAFQPGSAWGYSVATDVLARVLEVVLDRPLPDILDEHLLKPLGTRDTGFMVPASQAHRICPVYGTSRLDEAMQFDDQPQSLTPADVTAEYPHDDPKFWRGGIGLFSTLADYARIVDFLKTGLAPGGARLLSATSVQMMWTDRIPAQQKPLMIGPFPIPGYGYGLAGRVMVDLGSAQKLTGPGEFGWAGAASTYFWIDPVRDLTGIVMAQYIGSKIPIGEDFCTAVYQALDD